MLNVSKNKCVGCGVCVEDCPTVSISIRNGRARINRETCVSCGTCVHVCPQNAVKEIGRELMIAIGTDDESRIKADDHVGMSKYFQVWRYADSEFVFLETRENAKYAENGSQKHGDPGKAKATASALRNIDVLIGQMFGPNISRLRNKFVCGVVRGNRSIADGLDVIRDNINEILEEIEKHEKRGIILTAAE